MTNGRIWIDSLREPDQTLSRNAIKQILPYGESFLFIDRVLKLTQSQVEAEYVVPEDLDCLKAHFVHFPIMPGVLLGESFAQAGTLLVRYRLEQPRTKDILAYQIENAQFQKPAVAKDRLVHHIHLKTYDSRLARVVGQTYKEQQKICSLQLLLAIVDREEFIKSLSSQSVSSPLRVKGEG